jgi:hypothetical protein
MWTFFFGSNASNVPNYREVAIYLVSDYRIGDMRLRDDGNAFRGPNMGVAFSIWVNGDRPSFAVIG